APRREPWRSERGRRRRARPHRGGGAGDARCVGRGVRGAARGMSDGDEPLADGAELLHRHVHPSWMVDGEPASLAFRPSKKDEGRLSVDRGALATAEQAFLHHTSTLKLDAVGTWSFTVEEATAAGLK